MFIPFGIKNPRIFVYWLVFILLERKVSRDFAWWIFFNPQKRKITKTSVWKRRNVYMSAGVIPAICCQEVVDRLGDIL